jgi:hypothetical protein
LLIQARTVVAPEAADLELVTNLEPVNPATEAVVTEKVIQAVVV